MTEQEIEQLEQDLADAEEEVKAPTEELKDLKSKKEQLEKDVEELEEEVEELKEENDSDTKERVLKIFADPSNWQGNCFIPNDATVLAVHTFPDKLAESAL